MCLYSTKMYNKKYTANIKNGGIIPEIKDNRIRTIAVGCGNCYECMKKRGNEWKVRLYEELNTKENERGHFVTLSFTDDQLIILEKAVRIKYLKAKKEAPIGYKMDNEIATIGTRRFLERWRKKNGVSVKHWFITELGQKNTERIHIHGIIWSNKIKPSNEKRQSEYLDNIWQYGNTWVGKYINESTMGYLAKYFTKKDKKHPNYKGKILTTPGIGKEYLNTFAAKLNEYNGKNTYKKYRNKKGFEMNLPKYYYNKLYTEEQREELWLMELDKEERYIFGEKVNVSTSKGLETYYKLLKYYRKINKEWGFGNKDTKWQLKEWETMKRIQLSQQRHLKKRVRHEPTREMSYRHQLAQYQTTLQQAFDTGEIQKNTEPLKKEINYLKITPYREQGHYNISYKAYYNDKYHTIHETLEKDTRNINEIFI